MVTLDAATTALPTATSDVLATEDPTITTGTAATDGSNADTVGTGTEDSRYTPTTVVATEVTEHGQSPRDLAVLGKLLLFYQVWFLTLCGFRSVSCHVQYMYTLVVSCLVHVYTSSCQVQYLLYATLSV